MARRLAGDRAAGPAAGAGGRPAEGLRTWVRQIMGTAISIATWTGEGGLPDATAATAAAVERAFAELRAADERFSPFKPESQISRLRDGAVRLERCDAEVRGVLALCERLRRDTGGYFDAYAAGPDRLDPCGVVKGWAAERASDLLLEAGVASHYVNAGGDVRLRGQPGPDRLWRIGIADPHRPGELIATVRASDLGIATSGIAERGAHVLDPHRGAPAVELASVTVVGESLTLADAYATAAVAMGPIALDWLAGLDGYEALLVAADGAISGTPGFP
jgi:thiamine biosynthesis lipoprotein